MAHLLKQILSQLSALSVSFHWLNTVFVVVALFLLYAFAILQKHCSHVAKLDEKTEDNKSKVFQGNHVPFLTFPPHEDLLDIHKAAQNSLKKSAIGMRAHIIAPK